MSPKTAANNRLVQQAFNVPGGAGMKGSTPTDPLWHLMGKTSPAVNMVNNNVQGPSSQGYTQESLPARGVQDYTELMKARMPYSMAAPRTVDVGHNGTFYNGASRNPQVGVAQIATQNFAPPQFQMNADSGVRPGQFSGPNAVQAARAQQGGPVTDPRRAVLAAYN